MHVVPQASHTGGGSGSGMPEWMKRMHAAVESSQVSKAVRLFLVKVVVHVERRHAERGQGTRPGQQASTGPSPASPQVGVKTVQPPASVLPWPLLLGAAL